jgi:hypothetical protein
MAAALIVLASSSCDTLNVGGTPFPFRGPIVTIVVPQGMNGGEDATWTANWVGGTGPYSISWNWGGGANPNTAAAAGIAGSTNSQTVTMVNPSLTDSANYNVTVTVTDSQGLGVPVTVAYTVGPTLNTAPTITSTSFNNGTLTVTVADVDNNDVTVTIVTPAGVTAVSLSDVVSGGNGDATFSLSADDIFGGASGDVQITADDGQGGTDTATQAVSFAGITLEPDTLIAVPLQGSAGTAAATNNQNQITSGDIVRVVVATGVPANPFQFLNGVGVTVPGGVQGGLNDQYDITQGAVYAANTFNAGAVGGDAGAVDGFWTTMAPGGGFLLPPDNFIKPTDIGGGLIRIDFNLTPIGGSDVTTADGELFNFGMAFGIAGSYELGFQEFETVNRTYYQDGANNEYFWGDITNDGVPNTITVN